MSSLSSLKDTSLPCYMIPERISSKLKSVPTYQQEIESSSKRKASIQSQLSNTASMSDLIDLKIEDAEADNIHGANLYDIAQEAAKSKVISNAEFNEVVLNIQRRRNQKDNEILTVKKRRKFIVEDLEDELASGEVVFKAEKAYADMVVHSVMKASSNTPKQPWSRKRFKTNVDEFLQACRDHVVSDNLIIKQRWCHVLGKWLRDTETKVAHLVPLSLSGAAISYLFGVESLNFEDKRIGITLHRNIESALDDGHVVIMPVSQPGRDCGSLEWKLVLTTEALRNQEAMHGVKWNHLDGKILQFRGASQPARRFLYFRFIVTYIHCRNAKRSLSWAEAETTKGRIWATPGPYLRLGMLKVLAKAGDDFFLPETLEQDFKANSFVNTKGSLQVDEKTEKDFGRKLSFQMQQAGIEDDSEESETD